MNNLIRRRCVSSIIVLKMSARGIVTRKSRRHKHQGHRPVDLLGP